MKKNYETPIAELVLFTYRDQIVASSGGAVACVPTWVNTGKLVCETTPELYKNSNM